jgi:putative endonuclease
VERVSLDRFAAPARRETLVKVSQTGSPTRPADRRRQTGLRGEEIAAAHLQALGYEIVARNVRTRYGELDIVARDGGCLVFVEVKTRRSTALGAPEEAVDARKLAQIAALAESYLATLGGPVPECRIEVVAVELLPSGEARRIAVLTAD